MLSSGSKPLPRSPAGLLSTQLVDEPLSRSPSGLSSTSISPMAHPGVLRRRSTDTSGGLDYYWSSYAGAGPNSSSSSLAISPSPSSNFALSAAASSPVTSTAPTASKSRSSMNLREAEKSKELSDTIPVPRQQSAGYFSQFRAGQASGSSSRNISPKSLQPDPTSDAESDSHRGWSGDSDYSSEDMRNNGRTGSDSGSSFSAASPLDYRTFLTDHNEARRGLLDRSSEGTEGEERGDRWVRESITSQTSQMTQTTYRPSARGDDEDDDTSSQEMTPVPNAFVDRMDRTVPAAMVLDRTPRQDYPTRLLSPTKQSTPTRPLASPSAAGYTPTSGRIPFTSPDAQRTSPTYGVEVTIPSPQSAPAWKSEFGEVRMDEEEDPVTIKARGKRTTLPATTSTSSGALVDAMLSPERDMLSPQSVKKVRDATPERRSREASPGRSPEPPPRSSLRAAFQSGSTSPLSYSPRMSQSKDLSVPTIINTPDSPDSRMTDERTPGRFSQGPSRTGSASSATINDLAEMLGGAIDAIGLVDSRDIPPPTSMELRREKRDFISSPLGPAAEVVIDNGRVSPSSLPSRGPSLKDSSVSSVSSVSASLPPPRRPLQALRKVSSGLSLNRSHQAAASPEQSTTTLASISQRPWPAAMLYGNIKGMKYTGDRAKAYARNINDLSRAETGLREWCTASAASPYRAPSPRKSSAMASLGVGSRTSSFSTASTLAVPGSAAHMRNVSSGSEFPMRADSYAAREISQRVVDPSDAPASLPPNLPYPQLQAQYANGNLGGMRSSPSMQSVASHTSKRSFFSGIGKKSSSKKETSSLGPPAAGASSKKDVRGLPISSPSYTSGPLPKSVSPSRNESRPVISAPMGPRSQRLGSFTPPPTGPERNSIDGPGRASLDTGLTRMSSMRGSRTSLDGMARKGSLPPRQASAMGVFAAASGGPKTPSAEDVQAMANILPHINKGVIRVYLAKYGDPMQAIGMYLEDEKRGTVMRG